jgi:spore germination protein
MMKFLSKLMSKSHNRPSTDKRGTEPKNLPQGKLGTYKETIQKFKEIFDLCNDVKMRELPAGMVTDSLVYVIYIEPLSTNVLLESAFAVAHNYIDRPKITHADDAAGSMDVVECDTLTKATEKVLEGWTLFLVKKSNQVLALNTYGPPSRSIDRSETESIILGPQEAFTEQIRTNLGIMRQRIKSPDFKIEPMQVGKFTKKLVAIAYMKGLVQQEYLDTVRERLQKVDIDYIFGSGDLAQMIDDNPFSPFPQYHMTERPERIMSHLMDGKVALFIDGSPFAMSAPATFIEFFQTSEDYMNRWISASVIRTLRIVGVLISISLSALYVAVVTYHYQMIPSKMLITLTQSRARVPFPPIYETLLMEVTIELLREAGARLPTKVGQTIGIVGGIVIGQAAVAAGFASNILIISVALSTIASFITPSYIMSSALRALRFFLILFAGLWGIYGLTIGLLMMVIHALRLSSLGTPYLTPFAPLRLSDLKDTFIRLPLPFMKYRPTSTRPREAQRLHMHMPVTDPAVPTSTSVDSERGDTP